VKDGAPLGFQFSGYWFKAPEEIEWLFEHLTHAQLKVLLTVLKAEQRDQDRGKLGCSASAGNGESVRPLR
jgi:hypothetical protein